jgi:hypothetical protein
VSFRSASVGGRPAPLGGQVDYRLARQHTIAEYKRGRLGRNDVCDAQRELLRNAAALGRPAGEPCPICEADRLVHVTYVFGPRLPASGRCVASAGELARLARSPASLTAYVVEVCCDCSWNHLARTFLLGGR